MAACLALALGLAAATASGAPRVVAVGDVHGDLASFKAILAEAGVLGAGSHWSGGDTLLVQVGDLIDRGPGMRATLDFVMALAPEAEKAGGRVVSLLGNHEVMNLAGDLRYVVPANWAEFSDAGSEKRRQAAWKEVVAFSKRRAEKLGRPEPPSDDAAREAWLAKHPPGYLEQREAFGPDGAYGRWLRQRPAAFLHGGTAFVHGGLSPAFAAPLPEVDRRVHDDIAAADADRKRFVAEGLILPFFDLEETFQALREDLAALGPSGDPERRKVYERFLDWGSWTMNAEDGPLWFRGYGRWSDAEGDAALPALLAAAGAARFVVGHTVQPQTRVRVRFGGAVLLIDTGMLDGTYFPGGRPSALELRDGVATAIYRGEPRQVIWPLPLEKAAALR